MLNCGRWGNITISLQPQGSCKLAIQVEPMAVSRYGVGDWGAWTQFLSSRPQLNNSAD